MKVQFWVIGKTTDTYLLPGIHDYFKRIRRYCQFEYVELPAAKIGKNATETEIKNREERAVLEKLQKSNKTHKELQTLENKQKYKNS